MHAIRPNYAVINRAVRWCVLVMAVLMAMAVVLLAVVVSPARADPGATPTPSGPDQTLTPEQIQAQLDAAVRNGTATGTYVGPFGNERWVGVFGTHAASAGYGYPYAAAPDCDEGSLGAGCVGDSRGFIQGQCTSWVAFRLAARNGLSFSNWYADRHWGNAADWGKVAKGIGHKPDRTPAIGAIGWYKRGHVSYVEDVYSNGTILISEMNTDGHNGFHFATVSPGMSSYPDKFIHLDDVVPVDTAAPSVPAGVRVVAHRGRNGVTWRPSSDAFGVAGYRVLRNGVPLGTTRRTSWWDTSAPAGQATVYSVVAYDAAGHASRPGRAHVTPGAEAADRAWVETATGPAFCGRAGTARHQRLGCRVMTGDRWRTIALDRNTTWGEPTSRAFLVGSGGVSYCRAVGPGSRSLACTTLDAAHQRWGDTRVSQRTPRLTSDATWMSTPAGPARCGLSGARSRATCSVLSARGWVTATMQSRADPGAADTRAFLATADGTVAFCRWLPDDQGARTACASFSPAAAAWGADHVSPPLRAGAPAFPTWVSTAAGPAACWAPSARRRGACQVLGLTDWRTVLLPRRAAGGAPASQSFLTDQSGRLAWCRVAGRSAACVSLAANGSSWGEGSSTRVVRSLQAENRTWVQLASGPALCGRTGTLRQQRLGCQVHSNNGWRTTISHVTAWGNPGYRAFVPSGSGVAYCRTVPVRKRSTALSCTQMSAGGWGATRTSHRVPLALPDPF